MTHAWASVDADVIKAVDAVIDRTIRPLAAAVDGESAFPAEALADLAGEGLGVMLMPRSLGGAETSSSTYAEALARIAAECGSTSTVYMTQMHCAHPIHLQASPEQVETWIPRLCDGSAVGAIALTEPSAGSDVGTMRTLARRDGDEYVINGEKTFISNGDHADVIVLFASVDLGRGKDAVTAFLLETEGLEGLEVGTPMHKLGQKGASTVTLALQDCRIPASSRMGDEGEGYPLLLRSVVRSRISAAAQGVGFAQGAFDAVVAWASDRDLLVLASQLRPGPAVRTGPPAGEITAARAMLLAVCDEVDSGPEEPVAEVSLVKMHCTTLGTRVAAACVELLGPDGDRVSLGAERRLRDAKIAEIYDGTNQIQSMLVARDISLAAKAGRAAR